MYGTIFNLDVKPEHHEALIKSLQDQETWPDGSIAFFVMHPDQGEGLVGIVVFESKEAYMSNADSREQHQRFLEMMEHLASEPTWTDGTYVVGKILKEPI